MCILSLGGSWDHAGKHWTRTKLEDISIIWWTCSRSYISNRDGTQAAQPQTLREARQGLWEGGVLARCMVPAAHHFPLE